MKTINITPDNGLQSIDLKRYSFVNKSNEKDYSYELHVSFEEKAIIPINITAQEYAMIQKSMIKNAK